jgi:hypothetical protein
MVYPGARSVHFHLAIVGKCISLVLAATINKRRDRLITVRPPKNDHN